MTDFRADNCICLINLIFEINWVNVGDKLSSKTANARDELPIGSALIVCMRVKK